MEGIRDRLYGFVKFCPKQVEGNEKGEVKTDMAMDISFGSSGYALVLARAFRTVCKFLCINTCTPVCTQLYNLGRGCYLQFLWTSAALNTCMQMVCAPSIKP